MSFLSSNSPAPTVESLQQQVDTLAWLHAELVHNLGVMSARLFNPAANRLPVQRVTPRQVPQQPGQPTYPRPQPIDPAVFARQQMIRQRAIHLQQIRNQAAQAAQPPPQP